MDMQLINTEDFIPEFEAKPAAWNLSEFEAKPAAWNLSVEQNSGGIYK
jgi:hypothetical protein